MHMKHTAIYVLHINIMETQLDSLDVSLSDINTVQIVKAYDL